MNKLQLERDLIIKKLRTKTEDSLRLSNMQYKNETYGKLYVRQDRTEIRIFFHSDCIGSFFESSQSYYVLYSKVNVNFLFWKRKEKLILVTAV